MPKRKLPENWKPDENTRWWNISSDYKLSESFIRKYKDEVNWNCICVHQNISESFIREFKDQVYWNCISVNQDLSESFIKEFKDKVDWNYISVYQKCISHSLLNQYQYKIKYSWIDVGREYY